MNQVQTLLVIASFDRIDKLLKPGVETHELDRAIIPIVPERNQLPWSAAVFRSQVETKVISASVGQERHPSPPPPSRVVKVRVDHSVE